MIVEYQKNYQKIVMGLLSFQPDLHDYQRLQQELDFAPDATSTKILLWKDQNVDQFSAVMILQEGVDYILVRRVSFSPSERSGHSMYQFLSAVAKRYPGRRMMGTLATQPLITNWQRNNYYEQQAHEEQRE